MLTVAEMPSHDHGGKTGTPSSDKTGGSSATNTSDVNQNHTHEIPALSGSTNETGSHTHSVQFGGLDGGGPGTEGGKVRGTATSWVNCKDNGAHTHTATVNAGSLTSGDAAGAHTHSMAHTHNLKNHTHTIGSQGGTAHNNMPPYIAKFCWERTA